MNKLGQFLQEHVTGEVSVSADARHYFSNDGSVFSLTPSLVVYPRSESDVRKTARFTWQLAERGRVIPITPRGGGTDQGGAAIGSGIMMVFPAHLNRVLEFDSKSGVVIVEPGINYGTLQQTLQTHGRFLPPFPASYQYSTLGGAIGNNAAGEMSVKYGATRAYVKSLRVVLANGEVIETGRINKRELAKKLGLTTFEGEVYRALDAVLEENKDALRALEKHVTKNASGYDLIDIKRADGSFDLTPLFVGSQGTLGIVTEISMNTELYNPETTLLVASLDSVQQLQDAVIELRKAHDMPSAIEVVDQNVLTLVHATNRAMLRNVVPEPYPAFLLLVEYDDTGRIQRRSSHTAQKILHKYATSVQRVTDLAEQEALWSIRHASAMVTSQTIGHARALPLIEDGAVPIDKLSQLLTGVYDLCAKSHLQAAVWGHAGDANLHIQPYLDLSQLGDRQIAFRIIEEYYKLIIGLGGTISAEHGDGRLRGPYLPKLYGNAAYELLRKVKKIFDPHGTLNPGVKIDVTLDDIKPLLRQEYSLGHLHQHLPRT